MALPSGQKSKSLVSVLYPETEAKTYFQDSALGIVKGRRFLIYNQDIQLWTKYNLTLEYLVSF